MEKVGITNDANMSVREGKIWNNFKDSISQSNILEKMGPWFDRGLFCCRKCPCLLLPFTLFLKPKNNCNHLE